MGGAKHLLPREIQYETPHKKEATATAKIGLLLACPPVHNTVQVCGTNESSPRQAYELVARQPEKDDAVAK